MKTFIVLCCLVVVAIATPATLQLTSKWNEFKLTHSKTYENAAEEMKRLGIFYENLKKIEEHNKLYEQGLVSYKMGVNQFADWTHEEFKSHVSGLQRFEQKTTGTFARPLNVELPAAIDWRAKGVVTPVKNQRSCNTGSYAFSTTACVESHNAIKNGKLVSLSAQELIDCVFPKGKGCTVAVTAQCFDYVVAHGLTTEANYPFVNNDWFGCNRGNLPAAVHITGSKAIASGNETDLEAAVATVGPVNVAVEVDGWPFYSSGIYTGDCGQDEAELVHSVVAVGYGTNEKGIDYWILKNSWGTKWGEKGYIRLPRHQNKCGIATFASYPLL